MNRQDKYPSCAHGATNIQPYEGFTRWGLAYCLVDDTPCCSFNEDMYATKEEARAAGLSLLATWVSK